MTGCMRWRRSGLSQRYFSPFCWSFVAPPR
jgi:hypothetical protein